MENNLTPEQVIEKLNSMFSEKTANFTSKEDFEGLKAEFAKFASYDDSAVKTAIATLEGKLEGYAEGAKRIPTTNVVKSLGEAIADAYASNIEKINTVLEQKGGTVALDVKAVGTMTLTNNYTGGTVALTQLESGVARIQRRKPFLRELVNSAGTTSKYITYIEQSSPEGGAGMTAEGALKSQADFDLVERQAIVKKVTAWIKVSKEMASDLPFMQGEINTELVELVQLKLDEQILSGDGLGDNLVGILTNAVAFSAGGFALSVVAPNEADVLRVAVNQIEAENFVANYIVLHPEDSAKMELIKTTQGEYTYPMVYVNANGETRIKGIPVVTNTGVTAGTFLVGDFTKSNLRIREDLNIQVGFVNDDFTKNLFTILCEARATHYVKTNHYKAFVKGSFATAKSALLKP